MNSRKKKLLPPDDWEKLGELLEHAQSLETPERLVFLENIRKSHPHLSEDLERFLAQNTKFKAFLDRGPGLEFRADFEKKSKSPLPLIAKHHKTLSFPYQIGKYTLIEKLNKGGMAEVYRAHITPPTGSLTPSKIVAIKRILPDFSNDKALIKMFEREAKLSARLIHPNIVQTLDFLETELGYLMVMELVQGQNLRETLQNRIDLNRPIPLAVSLYLAREICEALNYAHNLTDPSGIPLNIVHRDISPENIMVSMKGEVKLFDFGIAKLRSESFRTATGLIKGKFAYMSPEQAMAKEVNRTSDLYSLGLVLYELLTGNAAIQGERDIEILKNAREGAVKNIVSLKLDIPIEISDLVAKATLLNPQERYQTAGELAQSLSLYLNRNSYSVNRRDIASLLNP